MNINMSKLLTFIKNRKFEIIIGIGGIGMSGMAELLFKSGYVITGSDIKITIDRMI